MKNKVYARIIAGVMAVTMLVQTAVPSSATEINNLKSDANETQDTTSSDDQEEKDLLNTTLNLDNYDQEDTTTYLNVQLTREKGFPEGVTGSVSALSDEDTEKLAEKVAASVYGADDAGNVNEQGDENLDDFITWDYSAAFTVKVQNAAHIDFSLKYSTLQVCGLMDYTDNRTVYAEMKDGSWKEVEMKADTDEVTDDEEAGDGTEVDEESSVNATETDSTVPGEIRFDAAEDMTGNFFIGWSNDMPVYDDEVVDEVGNENVPTDQNAVASVTDTAAAVGMTTAKSSNKMSTTTVFTYEDDIVSVTAETSKAYAVPEGAELHADELTGDAYEQAYQKAKEALNITDDNQKLYYHPFDVYFLINGQKIEPSADVNVSIKYKKDTFDIPEKDKEGNTEVKKVVHILNNGETEVMDNNANESKEDVRFNVASFSTMGEATVLTENGTDTENAYAILYSDGDLIFQRGNAIDESKGDVLGTFTGFEENEKGYLTTNASGSLSSTAPWMTSYYENDIKQISVRSGDIITPKNMSAWFYYALNFQNINLNGFDTSNVTDMRSMFSNCYKLTTLNLGDKFDTGNVTDMRSMFSDCYELTTLNLGDRFDTGNVTDMRSMFSNCYKLTTLNLGDRFDTGNVTDMSGVFYNCQSLTTLNLGDKFDTSNVTDMGSMFYGCYKLTTLNLGDKFGTNNVTDMGSMFRSCNNLTALNLGDKFNTSNVTSMYQMFSSCQSLTALNLGDKFDTSNVTQMYNMFSSCSSLTALNLGDKFDTSNVTQMYNMFNSCYKLTTLDLGDKFNTSNVTQMYNMFSNCQSLTILNLGDKFDTSNVTYMYDMFNNCYGLTTLNLGDKFNTSNVTNMYAMFSDCQNLTTLNLGDKFDTSNVTSMEFMFSGCSKLTSLDLSNWNTRNVTDMLNMFDACDQLSILIIGKDFRAAGNNLSFPQKKWKRASTGQIYDADRIGWLTLDNAETFYQEITAEFKPNGGIGSEKATVYADNASFHDTSVSHPWRLGYTFNGWYTEKTGGEKLNEGDQLQETTYYAHWTSNNYKLVLNNNPPTLLSSSDSSEPSNEEQTVTVKMKYDQFYNLTDQIFTCDGYVLSGWNTRRNGSGTEYDPITSVGNLATEAEDEVILYAQWRPLTDYASIAFDSQGGDGIESTKILKGTKITNLSNPSRKGYTFLGWHMNTADGTTVTKDTVINKDCTLVATWGKNPVVTFVSGLSGNIQKTVTYNGKIGTLPTYPTNSHRYQTLIGWFTQETGGDQITANTTVTEDTTYYAHWGWTPKFNANGGKITSTTEYPVQENSAYTIAELPEVVRDGYALVGWYIGDGVTEVHNADTIDLSQGVEIAAKWTKADTVTVTLDPNSGSYNYDKTIVLTKDAALTGVYSPTRYNYTFLGWMDADGTYYKNGDVISNDISLIAQWASNECTVTFKPGDGSSVYTSTKKVKKGGTLNAIPGARKSNYILKGWYTQENGQGEQLTTETKINGDVTYYAYYEPTTKTYETDDYSYTFGAEWSNSSNSTLDNVNDNLDFHPSSNNTQTASLHVRYELNKSIGDKTLPVGSVKIRVPKYIWKNWDGAWTGSNNVSSNLPKYPDKRNGMYFSYMEDGDDYILLNNQELSGGTGLDFTISYSVTPSDVPGGAKDLGGNYINGYDFYKGTIPVSVSVDTDNDDIANQTDAKNLSVEMHTNVQPSTFLSYDSISYTWSSAWGTKPADADDYFYVTWRAYASYSSSYQSQPYSYFWTEDTNHDGTVVRMSLGKMSSSGGSSSNSNSIILKYPIELLKDIPESGLKLTNQAVLNTTWKSGYEMKQAVSASVAIHDSEYPEGEFDKNNTVAGAGGVYRISAAQEDLVYDKKNVSMQWRLYYNGASRNSKVTWDEDTQTYKAASRTIEFTDGEPGDVMYSSGAADSKYIWEPVTGNYDLADDDYYISSLSIVLYEYDVKQVDGKWSDTIQHYNTSDYEGFDIYLRYKGESEYKFYQTVTGNGVSVSVTLPANVVGYKVQHATTFYSTNMSVTGTFILKPTDHVTTLIGNDLQEGVTSIIKDKAVCNIWNTDDETKTAFFTATDYTGGSNPANKECYELTKNTTNQYTKKYAGTQDKVIFDSGKGTQDNPMQIAGYSKNTGSGRKTPISTGVFYDLLPAGTTVDTSTVFGIPITDNADSYDQTGSYASLKNSSSKLSSGLYDIRFENNYKDSGRTMMIIKWAAPDLGDTKVTGMNFFYLLHNTYENVVDNGTSLENDVAFVNTSEQSAKPTNLYDSQTAVTEASYYDDLQAENEGYISYARASTDYIPVSAFSWGFDKTVKGQGSEYKHADETLPNEEYTYKLTYNQSDNATSNSIQFYDVLEYGSESKDESGNVVMNLSDWRGTFKSVDVSTISEKLTADSDSIHCKPVVYYSTKDRASFTGSDYAVTNTDTWTTTMPKDKSTITAIAVDCSHSEDGTDFVLKGRQSLSVYVTMTAPDNEAAYDKLALNTAQIYSKKETDLEQTSMISSAEMTLKEERLELHKTAASASGTAGAPAEVFKDTSLDYTLSVTNKNEEATTHDIVVEDTLPEGLLLDAEHITISFGDETTGASIASSPRASMTRTDRTVKFTISSLAAGEEARIAVPTIVNVGGGVIENTAKITKVNGLAREITSETTYHEAKPYKKYDLTIRKVNYDGSLIGGATLELTGRSMYDSKDMTPIQWTTEEGVEKKISLAPGEYILTELSSPEGYAIAAPIQIHFVKDATVTMYDVDGTSVAVNKVWNDGEDTGNRPASVEMELYQDGVYYKDFTVKAADNWQAVLDKLPKFAADDKSHIYRYTVKEKTLDKFIPTYTYYNKEETAENKIENITKSNDKSGAVTNSVLGVGTQVTTAEDSSKNNVIDSTNNIADSNNDSGNAAGVSSTKLRSINESIVLFTAGENGNTTDADTVITVTNTTSKTVKGEKVWADETDETRPSAVTIRLIQNGNEYATQEVSAATDWKFEFTDLPKYDENGNEYDYEVKEQYLEGYKVAYNQKAANGVAITVDYQTESASYDWFYIYYEKDGKLYRTSKYGGSSRQKATIKIPATKFWVEWKTDGSVNGYYGMKVTDVAALESAVAINGSSVSAFESGYSETTVTDPTTIESTHNPYTNNARQRWYYDSGLSGGVTVTNTKVPDETTIVQIAKVDMDGNGLAGAKMQLLDASGTVVKEWTSETTPEKWNGITPGIYTIHEVEAPDGYQLAKDQEIEITDTTELQSFQMVDRIAGKLSVTKTVTGFEDSNGTGNGTGNSGATEAGKNSGINAGGTIADSNASENTESDGTNKAVKTDGAGTVKYEAASVESSELRNTTGDDQNEVFEFKLRLTKSYLSLPSELRYTMDDGSEGVISKSSETDTTAEYEFTLSNKQTITFENIPIETAYEVTEVNVDSDKYQVITTNTTGTIDVKDISAKIENHKIVSGVLPDAGEKTIFFLILAATAVFAGGYVTRKRKQNKE